MNVNSTLFNENVIAPNPIKQLPAAVNALFVRHEVLQQLKFCGPQFQGLLLVTHTVSVCIQKQLPHLNSTRRLLRRTSSQNRTNSSQQFFGGKRFHDVIVCASIKACNPVHFITPGGEHQNRNRLRPLVTTPLFGE